MTSLIAVLQVACVLWAAAPSVICKNYQSEFEGKFYLHTRLNNTGVEVNTIHDAIHGSKATKLITHDYKESKQDYQNIVDKFLNESNLIMLSYEWAPAAQLNESDAAIAAVTLGITEVSTFLSVLQKKHRIKAEEFHLIGFGMGAHLMAAAARNQKEKIGRITGLDPTRKYFDGTLPINLPRLSGADAQFVDVYHTDAGQMGFEPPIATADFYPAGGYEQPRCILKPSLLCNHRMAKEYFAESFTYRHDFIARKCDSFMDFVAGLCNNNPTAEAGVNAPTNITGSYYFYPAYKPPYGRKMAGASPCK